MCERVDSCGWDKTGKLECQQIVSCNCQLVGDLLANRQQIHRSCWNNTVALAECGAWHDTTSVFTACFDWDITQSMCRYFYDSQCILNTASKRKVWLPTVSSSYESFADVHCDIDSTHQHSVNHTSPGIHRQTLSRTHKVTGSIVNDDSRQMTKSINAFWDCITYWVSISYVTLHCEHLQQQLLQLQ